MSVTAMAMVVCVAPATAASAEDTTLADEAASVEAVDVTDPSQRLPIDAEMRAAIVGALKADLAAPSRTAGQRNQTLRELAQLGVTNLDTAAGTAPLVVAATPTSLNLAVWHAAQENGYYCGPASAYMMLRYLQYSTSRYNGVTLSQTNVASATYLGTTSSSGTTWVSKGMQTGTNKWMQQSYYVQVQSPSASTVRGAFTLTIGASGQPLAADTVEWAGGAHYNGHPDRTIGHWIVGYGYADLGVSTRWLDPATSVYPGASQTFTVNTDSFVSFLQSNGIMY